MKPGKIILAILLAFVLSGPIYATNANYRLRTLLYSNNSQPQYGVNFTVTVYPVGARATASSSGTTITVAAGHGITAGQKILVGLSSSTYRTVSVAGATSLTVSSSVSVATDDYIINLGADTGVGSPNYDGSTVTIYKYPSLTSSISNATVTAGTTGEYEYYLSSGVSVWEVVRNSSGGLNAIVPYAVSAAAGSAGVGNVTSASASTAQGITTFTDTTGQAVQSSAATLTNAGSLTIPAEQGITVAPSTTAVNLLQVNANNSSQSGTNCATSGASGTYTFLDVLNTSGSQLTLCDGTSIGYLHALGFNLVDGSTSTGNYTAIAPGGTQAMSGISTVSVPSNLGAATTVLSVGMTTGIGTVTGAATGTVIGTISGLKTLPVSSLYLNEAFRVRAYGSYLTNGAASNETFFLKIGSSTVATTGVLTAFFPDLTNATKSWDLDVVCELTAITTAYTNTSWLCEGTVGAYATGITYNRAGLLNTATVSSVDASSGAAIDLQVTNSNANAITKGILVTIEQIR